MERRERRKKEKRERGEDGKMVEGKREWRKEGNSSPGTLMASDTLVLII